MGALMNFRSERVMILSSEDMVVGGVVRRPRTASVRGAEVRVFGVKKSLVGDSSVCLGIMREVRCFEDGMDGEDWMESLKGQTRLCRWWGNGLGLASLLSALCRFDAPLITF